MSERPCDQFAPQGPKNLNKLEMEWRIRKGIRGRPMHIGRFALAHVASARLGAGGLAEEAKAALKWGQEDAN